MLTARSPIRLAFAIAALTLAGCSYTREVTPWLRARREVPFRLMAESGSGGRDADRAWTERREGGRWVRLGDHGDGSFGFAGGTRAVVNGQLVRPDGPPVPLHCSGDLRATPDGSELLCVEIAGRFDKQAPPETVLLVRDDRDGQEIGRRRVQLPVRVPPGAPVIGPDVSTHFLGFLPGGLVFSVFESDAHTSFANSSAHHCRAFLLRPDDSWQELGAIRFQMPDLWKCNFPRPWNEEHGWGIAEGARERDAKGEPDP
jgi:hypothetical protein